MTQTENDQTKAFNPNEHIMQIKSGQSSKDYLPVQWRLVWFRSAFPYGSIETEMLHLDLDRDTEEEAYAWNAERRKSEKVTKHAKGFVIFKATVKDGQGGIATGTKSEKAASFGDFIEKAETGAIGRALAALGYGTQFTGDEWDEAHRIVDSPVERQIPEATNVSSNDRAESKQQRDQQSKQLQVSDPTIKAASTALYSAALQAKKRAIESKVIATDDDWLLMLSNLGITEFTTGKDIATVNNGTAKMLNEGYTTSIIVTQAVSCGTAL